VRLATVVACVLAVTPSRAHASPDPAGFALDYHAPDGAGCPTEPALRSAVADELGYDPFEILDDGVSPMIVVVIGAARDGVHGRIEMRAPGGKHLGARELAAPTCAELTPALELAIAVAIDPLRAALPPPQPKAPSPATSAATTTNAPPIPPAQQDDAEVPPPAPTGSPSHVGFADSVRLRVAFGVHVAVDLAPGAAFGLLGRVGFAARRWSAAVELRGDLPASGGDVDGGRVSAATMAGFLVPCVLHRVVAFCALAGAGGQHVAGEGYLAAREWWVPFAAFGGRIEVELAVTRVLAVAARVDVLAPVTRTELYVGTERPQRVYRTPPVSSTFGLLLSTR
jgi:hypothetical protein